MTPLGHHRSAYPVAFAEFTQLTQIHGQVCDSTACHKALLTVMTISPPRTIRWCASSTSLSLGSKSTTAEPMIIALWGWQPETFWLRRSLTVPAHHRVGRSCRLSQAASRPDLETA